MSISSAGIPLAELVKSCRFLCSPGLAWQHLAGSGECLLSGIVAWAVLFSGSSRVTTELCAVQTALLGGTGVVMAQWCCRVLSKGMLLWQ